MAYGALMRQFHQFSWWDIEYVEQPCATVEELRELKKRVDVKIVGDEVIRKAKDPFAIDLTGCY
jgi:L-alanine-DL-glutamate epimerase-like enolase superfamily enzyme